jgi:Uncharacterized protein conserved in bacteria
MIRSTLRRSTLPAALLTLALAACGGSNDSSSPSSGVPGQDTSSMPTSSASPSTVGTPATGEHNDADVAFATGMIPHHGQAVTMAQMATATAANAEVKKLASTIKAAQIPEITRMSGWLTGWGQPIPSSTSSMGGVDMGDGMMTDDDLKELGGATGTAFDRMWLQMMIKHHQGAIRMATTELKTGTNPDARQLAQNIITSQTSEITRMKKLEATLG